MALALIATASFQLSAPTVAFANCGATVAGFHYVYQGTALNGYGGLYNPPNCVGQGGHVYYGWIGVNGLITYPSHYPDLANNPYHNHSLGYLGIVFSNGSWLQEGWFAGCLNEVSCEYSGLGRYTEIYDPGGPIPFQFTDWTQLGNYPTPFSGSSIFRVEYAGTSCWNMYLDYSDLKRQYCSLSISGQPQATSEVLTNDGSSVEMPTTLYGYPALNTNSTLRIKGANGWVNWTTTLSSHTTGYYDERSGQPGCGTPPCLYYNIQYVYMYYDLAGSGQ